MTSIRPTGIEHAAAALRNIERRQDVIANNLANVSTAGFKGERVFARLLDAERTATIGTATDLRAGPLTTTGSPLDVAIERAGFFVVSTPDGERWTRGGAFALNEERNLVDASGATVLGEGGGPVTIPSGARDVRIGRTGAVVADGKEVTRLRLEQPGTNGEQLEHLGDGHLRPSAKAQSVADADRTIRQGSIEESNVGSMESMVDLIAVQRAYGGVMKVLTTIDSMSTIAATQIGKPS